MKNLKYIQSENKRKKTNGKLKSIQLKKLSSKLKFSVKYPANIAFGAVPIKVAIPPMEEEYAIERNNIFLNSSSCLIFSNIDIAIGSIKRQVAVLDNHMLKKEVEIMKPERILSLLLPKNNNILRAIRL